MATSEGEMALIATLKREQPPRGVTGLDADGRPFRFRIVGRGETAFYQEGERALLFEVLVGAGVISRRSLRAWDDGKRVTEQERDRIVAHAADYLRAGRRSKR
jgi:hypothetical protein